MTEKWEQAQSWESDWWGNCGNTYGEEEKQWLYARKMLLGDRMWHNRKSPYNIKMDGKTVIDIGGGPASLLLKCTGLVRGVVIDPLKVPTWVEMRYEEAGLEYIQMPAEELFDQMIEFHQPFDEAWIYNCLQHTQDPQKIIDNAFKVAKVVRIFEWLETRINEGHPHTFTKEMLDKMLGGEGKVSLLKGEAHCFGKAYHGLFVGV